MDQRDPVTGRLTNPKSAEVIDRGVKALHDVLARLATDTPPPPKPACPSPYCNQTDCPCWAALHPKP
jgi:hypothetical protein